MYRGKQRLQQRVGGKQRQQPRRKKFANSKANASFGWRGGRQVPRDPSVAISPDWELIDEMQISALAKMHYSEPSMPVGRTVHRCGSLKQFNSSLLGISPSNEQPLLQSPATFFRVTVSEDPIIQQLAMTGAASVFFTDAVLSALMCSPRSFDSFDIVVNKVGDSLFFDKRDGSILDLVTVDETAAEPPTNENGRNHINAPGPLAREAAHVNQMFSQHALKRDSKTREAEPNPFVTEAEQVPAAVAYHYRQFDLAGDVKLIVRCEIEAYGTPSLAAAAAAASASKEPPLITIKALNEYDPHETEWRSKIETQRGAILATELKNNNNKIARWTAQSLVAGTSQIILGFITRLTPHQNQRHALVGMQAYSPEDLSFQINLVPSNMWGIVEHVVDVLSEQDDGKYLIFRDPNENMVRTYALPANAFDDGDDAAADDDGAPAERHTMESVIADMRT